MPVRLASPQGVEGLSEIVQNPIYATGVGLLLYAQKQFREGGREQKKGLGVSGVFGRIKTWIKNNF